MELTKFTHSCVRLSKDGRALVVDPGVFSEARDALAGAAAVLVTHEHPDHVDADALRAALEADGALELHAPAGVADQFAGFGERVHAVRGGESFETAGFAVRTFGDQHAVLHPRIPVIANVGFLVDDTVFHPGDQLTVPPVELDTLLFPGCAPWSTLAQSIDYAIAVRPHRIVPIHEAVYSEAGRSVVNGQTGAAAGEFGSEYVVVEPGDSLTV